MFNIFNDFNAIDLQLVPLSLKISYSFEIEKYQQRFVFTRKLNQKMNFFELQKCVGQKILDV